MAHERMKMPAPEIPSSVKDEEEIFLSALALPPSERATYLDQCCRKQPEIRKRIERLLNAHEDAGFMQGKAVPSILDSFEADAAKLVVDECGTRIGNYKLLEKIGEGGCGMVYMAQQEVPIRRTVALKIIKFGTDTKSVIARFQQERQALAMMEHPNIARVFDAGTTEKGRPFFVMELVRGIKITTYCDDHQLPTSQRLALFMQVCQALQHAHQKGIIHRDIKPSNILVTLDNGTPTPKVIDFGIAKATSGERLTEQTLFTAFAQFIGTPAYMSPEQAELSSLDIDTRSDIYSLGVLLYELLTGHTPFDGKALISSGIDAMRKTIREKEPLKPSTRLTQDLASTPSADLLPQRLAIPTDAEACAQARKRERLREQIARLRGDLDWIVLKCLEKDRARRYETASGLVTDIQRHLNNEPVVARPPSTAYRFQKAWKRNKVAFSAAAAVVLALVLGFGFSTLKAFEANRERDKAHTAQYNAEKSDQARTEALRQAQHYLYLANINLAGQAWEHHSYLGLRQRLAETQETRDRGFEWYYWARQAHRNLIAMRGHQGPVSSIAFSPDGQRLVTGGDDKTVRIWSVATGHALHVLKGHEEGVTCVVFSPDGQTVASAGSDGAVRFWNSITGAELPGLARNSNSVCSVAFSPDGKQIITGGEDRTAKIWNIADRRLMMTFQGHEKGVRSARFSPDGQTILSASDDRTARLWRSSDGTELQRFHHNTEIYAALFFPNGQQIVTGGITTAKIWDVADGHQLPVNLESDGTKVALAISADGQHIANGSWDSTARLWNATNGQVERLFLGHIKGVNDVAISPDGMLVATAANDGGVKIWPAKDDRERLTVAGTKYQVLSTALSPDGEHVVTGTGILNLDGTVEGSGELSAAVWDATGRSKLFDLTGHDLGVSSVAYSRDGSKILTGSGDGTAKLWNATNGHLLQTLTGHTGSVSCVTFNLDGSRLVTGGQDSTARVWDAKTGLEIFQLSGHRGPVASVAVSADGKSFFTGSFDGSARMWNSVTRRLDYEIRTELQRVLTVSCSPDNRWLLTAGFGHTAYLWDLRDSTRKPVPLDGHSNVISSSAFSPDGTRVLTGSYDQTTKLWELATGREVLSLTGHKGPIFSAGFSCDGRTIITSSHDGTVRLWGRATPEQVAAWSKEENSPDLSLGQ